MFPFFSCKTKRLDRVWRSVFFLLAVLAGISRAAAQGNNLVFTNVTQLLSAPPEVLLGHCGFQLSGVVTLIDTNRELFVLQSDAGAVALNPAAGLQSFKFQLGEKISLEGSGCSPYLVGFPNYPYRPST